MSKNDATNSCSSAPEEGGKRVGGGDYGRKSELLE